jgi:HlyD family secretion protein
MKKGCTISILVFLAIAFAGALFWLYQKNAQPPVVYETEKAEVRSISKSTVATGNINPKEEVLIKPNISGIIDEVYVEAGDYVKSGDLLAKLKLGKQSDQYSKNRFGKPKKSVRTSKNIVQ